MLAFGFAKTAALTLLVESKSLEDGQMLAFGFAKTIALAPFVAGKSLEGGNAYE